MSIVSKVTIAKFPGVAHTVTFEGHEISLEDALALLARDTDRPEVADTKGYELRVNNGAPTKPADAPMLQDRDVVLLAQKIKNGFRHPRG